MRHTTHEYKPRAKGIEAMNEHDDDVLIDEPLLSKPIKRYRLSMTVNKVEELKTVECRNG